MIFSVEFVRILSISDGEQPGFSCVASEITGIKLLLYRIFSNWLELLSKRLKLKSPSKITFFSGNLPLVTSQIHPKRLYLTHQGAYTEHQ